MNTKQKDDELNAQLKISSVAHNANLQRASMLMTARTDAVKLAMNLADMKTVGGSANATKLVEEASIIHSFLTQDVEDVNFEVPKNPHSSTIKLLD